MKDLNKFLDIVINTSIVKFDYDKLKRQAKDMKTSEELYQLLIFYLRTDAHAQFFSETHLEHMIDPVREMKSFDSLRPQMKIKKNVLTIMFPKDIYFDPFFLPTSLLDYYEDLKSKFQKHIIKTVIVDMSECNGGTFDYAFLFIKFLFQYRKSLKGIAYLIHKNWIEDISEMKGSIIHDKVPTINLSHLENIKVKIGIGSHSAAEVLPVIMMCLVEKYNIRFIGCDTDGYYNTGTKMLEPYKGYILMLSDSLIMSHNGFISRGPVKVKELNERL